MVGGWQGFREMNGWMVDMWVVQVKPVFRYFRFNPKILFFQFFDNLSELIASRTAFL
jgi:hypothetical protein